MSNDERKATRRYATLLTEAEAKATKLQELRDSPIAHIDPDIQGRIVAYEAMMHWLYHEIQAAEDDLETIRNTE